MMRNIKATNITLMRFNFIKSCSSPEALRYLIGEMQGCCQCLLLLENSTKMDGSINCQTQLYITLLVFCLKMAHLCTYKGNSSGGDFN